MNLEDVGAVLAKAAAFDNRTIGDANLLAWHEILGDLDVADCLAAISQHHRESTEYLMPAHVRRIALKLRNDRNEQQRQLEQRQAIAASFANGPLRDRSADILAMVDQVRSVLPDGDVQALAPRHEFWRREHQAHLRQEHAEPNPDFVPGAAPVTTWQASKRPPDGAWWEDDTAREASARELLADAGRLHPRRNRTQEVS